MSQDDFFASVETAANFRNHEVVLRALNARPRQGRPPNVSDFACYEWEDDLFGDWEPSRFFSTSHGHPEWWQDLWECHVWLERPRVWLERYTFQGSEYSGWAMLGLHSPPSFRETWYNMQASRTDGALFYGVTVELEGAIISNPNLRKLAVRWCRRRECEKRR